jgi:hypothetical protein
MAWKYIVLRLANREVPIIFPESLVHRQVAEAITGMYAQTAVEMSNGMLTAAALDKLTEAIVPVAAGEVTLDIGKASGGSETLGVRSRPTDSAWLRNYSYHHGIIENLEVVPTPGVIHVPPTPVLRCLLCHGDIPIDGYDDVVTVDNGGACHGVCYRRWQSGEHQPVCYMEERERWTTSEQSPQPKACATGSAATSPSTTTRASRKTTGSAGPKRSRRTRGRNRRGDGADTVEAS